MSVQNHLDNPFVVIEVSGKLGFKDGKPAKTRTFKCQKQIKMDSRLLVAPNPPFIYTLKVGSESVDFQRLTPSCNIVEDDNRLHVVVEPHLGMQQAVYEMLTCYNSGWNVVWEQEG
ncbi:hypothetical protein A2533_05165 [Candidatus Falkowbacteria bacterium RIFOXYD2_FULL_35_9]|uniref:Uncharacterized protein n=1 Tax=Candidatus Falkowbacteria bacterium RIFOXYC2_FULL_36_12 TaxID=1798002 RepID=A0A1F5T078_9BACT|nr:MAG: hypothetical protein A2300_03535 [Candidatus Falkowbacteria bacterium RIFOXYB2_FULL_35_7]OGF32364.1 MAG: hypothetical protein A2478_03530 [Candidatus Falkowbacteria bacterium RIFOXYC2_FULL_36_12]OGF33259.1 MAG: hypothetical protein A2223_04010 [Candidatus Falkowbacteria bacterium RIFOXYA2_FULL_35_8]OGF46478.1 MAG: hypothetical protein A2533_05165 [Candidatus Falkowbacteria bacterium RIFOXYD2_FULL_35_9]